MYQTCGNNNYSWVNCTLQVNCCCFKHIIVFENSLFARPFCATSLLLSTCIETVGGHVDSCTVCLATQHLLTYTSVRIYVAINVACHFIAGQVVYTWQLLVSLILIIL